MELSLEILQRMDKRWFSIYYELGIDGLVACHDGYWRLFLAMLASIAAFSIKRKLKSIYMLVLMLEK